MDGKTSLALVALGSNLDDPERKLTQALEILESTSGVRIVATSSFLRTFPTSVIERQPLFLNSVVLLETTLDPLTLLDVLQETERALHRVRTVFWGPRTLDLDLLVYDDLIMSTGKLTLPHPRLQWRDFVLVPACEIVPDYVVPGLGKTFRELRTLLFWTFDSFSMFSRLLRNVTIISAGSQRDASVDAKSSR